MGSWHSESDIPIRLMILRKTHETFQRIRLPCDPEVFQNTLEEIVPQLELALYDNATSLEEYGNPRTVEQRLEAIAPLHVQLNPLEVLWLQGLFSTGTPVASHSTSGDGEHRYSFSIGSALSQPTRQSLPSLLITTEPSQVQTPQATIVLEPTGPSSSAPRETDPNTALNRDPYTQSLVELYQALQEYEETSSGLSPVEISAPERELTMLGRDQNPSIDDVLDLTCHEQLNGNGSA